MSKFGLAYFVDSYEIMKGETDFDNIFKFDDMYCRIDIFPKDTINFVEISINISKNVPIKTAELRRRIFINKIDALEFLYAQPSKYWNPNLDFTICDYSTNAKERCFNLLYYLTKTNKCIYYFKIWNNIDLLDCLLRYFFKV